MNEAQMGLPASRATERGVKLFLSKRTTRSKYHLDDNSASDLIGLPRAFYGF